MTLKKLPLTEHMQATLAKVLAATRGCRPDMHELDEQGIDASIVGCNLDNAMGNHVDLNAIKEGYQEFVVVLRRDGQILEINLASLIALARRAK